MHYNVMNLEISLNSQENTCVRVSLLKKRLTQVFSCEFYEISKNTFSTNNSRRLLLHIMNPKNDQFSWKYPTHLQINPIHLQINLAKRKQTVCHLIARYFLTLG